MIKVKNKRSITYVVIFVVLFMLCLLFPYSGDDWAWGSSIGMERLSIWFDNYSGRYFGNLIVLVLTRSNFLKAVAMSICLGGIIVILNEITRNQKCGVGLILTVLVFMPVTLLRQSVVWTAGFSNYTTSIFFTLIYIYYIRNIYDNKKLKNSYIAAVLLLVLGFLNALIVEHLTIYNVILGIYAVVFTLIKYKKIYIQHGAYLLGSLIGTAVMFSNSVYSSVAKGEDGYRTITTDKGIIYRAYDSFVNVIAKEGFLNNFVLLACLLVICLVIWFEVKSQISGRARMWGTAAVFVNIAYVSLSFMNQLNTYWLKEDALLVLEALAVVLYVLSLMVFVLILPYDVMKKVELIFAFMSAVIMMGPLLVVTPIGSRCFFASYIMLLYFTILLYSHFSERHKKQFAQLSRTFMVVSFAGALYLFYIYGTIAKSNGERIDKAIAEAKNKENVIEVKELPYKDYVWCSDVEEEPWSTRFKLYYGIDEKIKIKMLKNQ